MWVHTVPSLYVPYPVTLMLAVVAYPAAQLS